MIRKIKSHTISLGPTACQKVPVLNANAQLVQPVCTALSSQVLREGIQNRFSKKKYNILWENSNSPSLMTNLPNGISTWPKIHVISVQNTQVGGKNLTVSGIKTTQVSNLFYSLGPYVWS